MRQYRDVVVDWADRPVGEITPATPVTQTFVANHDRLSGVGLWLATYGRRNDCDVVFHLRRDGEPADLVTRRIRCDSVADNSLVKFEFEPVGRALDGRFAVVVESPNGRPGNAVTLWMASIHGIYPEGDLLFGSQPTQGCLRFVTYHR